MANKIKDKITSDQEVHGKSLFSKLEEGVDLDALFERYFSGRYLGYLIYVLVIGLIYISNSHINDKLTREQLKLKKDLEGLRAEYVTLKQEFLHNSRRSEVAQKVKKMGLSDDGGRVYRLEDKK